MTKNVNLNYTWLDRKKILALSFLIFCIIVLILGYGKKKRQAIFYL